MDQETVNRLIYEYAYGLISKDDYLVLIKIFHDESYNDKVKIACESVWTEIGEKEMDMVPHTDIELDELYSKLTNAARFKEEKKLPLRRYWYHWTAVVFIVLGLGTYLYFGQIPYAPVLHQAGNPSVSKVVPGGNKAVLTLADGSEVILDEAADGKISQQSGVTVIKLKEGQLAYKGGNSNEKITYNTIRTPKGGQYQLQLADGTNVWLNAASSLKFPTRFAAGQREVELTGEGYFEVTHDQQRPFLVRVQEMDVEVLGTSFNINAYNDEQAVKTTLLKGKIKVDIGEEKELLQPGQQIRFDKVNKKIQKINDSNTDLDIAWKNGYFSFKGADIQEVLRQVSRWYDIEIEYERNIPKRRFAGQFSRDSELKDVLKILEESDVKLKLDGKILHVRP